MKLSYIILTHNRCKTLLHTLGRVKRQAPPPPDQYEIWVVDNGSTDGTAQAIVENFPHVRLIRRRRNEGVWARHYAIERATGQYIGLLDDDSYPLDDATTRSMRFLDRHPTAAAVTGSIVLPDGSKEASALPSVPINCALVIRNSALQEIGGFRFCRHYGRQAEEYELAIRLLEKGHTLHRFEDLCYRHEKAPGSRPTPRIHRLDMRNNLVIVSRYLPKPLRKIYQQDWLQRYRAIARHCGFENAARLGYFEARLRSARQRLLRHGETVSHRTIESLFDLSKQAKAVADWAGHHRVRRVVIADWGKNLYATYRACHEAELEIRAVADNSPAFSGMRYRDVQLKTDPCAIDAQTDGIVLSNINPAQVDARLSGLHRHFDGPILRLWHPRHLSDPVQRNTPSISQPQKVIAI